jgi:hypothetical protein
MAETRKPITITETEGAAETRFSQVLDVSNYSDWTAAYDTDIGQFNEGQVEITASLVPNSSAEYQAIEVRAVGYVGPIATILGTWMLGGAKTIARTPIEQGEAYDRMGIEARLVTNGAAGQGGLAPTVATLSVGLKLWR